jgi:hypothetical protein
MHTAPVAGFALALCVGAVSVTSSAALGQAMRQEKSPERDRTLTGKEKLSGKAADEQRVNDCKVPAAQRTRTDRPTECETAPQEPPARASADRK